MESGHEETLLLAADTPQRCSELKWVQVCCGINVPECALNTQSDWFWNWDLEIGSAVGVGGPAPKPLKHA